MLQNAKKGRGEEGCEPPRTVEFEKFLTGKLSVLGRNKGHGGSSTENTRW